MSSMSVCPGDSEDVSDDLFNLQRDEEVLFVLARRLRRE